MTDRSTGETLKLHVDSIGSGPDLVVLHGWALHCGLFDVVADALAENFRVHFVDLPGHGHNAAIELPDDIHHVADMVLASVPRTAYWLGWSLGGMTALAAAIQAPGRIRKLVTVASTPKFVAGTDWPHAIPESTLNAMAEDLRGDYHATVRNFLSLQVLGDDHAYRLLRELRQKAYAHGEPAAASLVNGLEILRKADLRDQLEAFDVPLLAIMGSRDRLAPPKAGEALARAAGNGRSVTIDKAAHAPFISHRDEFLSAIEGFLVERG